MARAFLVYDKNEALPHTTGLKDFIVQALGLQTILFWELFLCNRQNKMTPAINQMMPLNGNKTTKGRHDTQHNDSRHNDTQHSGLTCDTQH